METEGFLHAYSAESLLERLRLVKRNFSRILVYGFIPSATLKILHKQYPQAEIWCAARAAESFCMSAASVPSCKRLCCGEEELPFAWNTFDMMLFNLTLHWVNDVPGVLAQVRQFLKPEGLFLASLLGECTARELKTAFSMAESELSGGLSPRFIPLIDLKTASALMMRAGFSLPVADCDRLTVMYRNPFDLMKELRQMGETNALLERPKNFTPRRLFTTAAHHYHAHFQTPEGYIPATFDIVYLTGWAPSLSSGSG